MSVNRIEREEEESLPVGFLDFVLGGFRFNAKSVVELCFCYHIQRGYSMVLSMLNERRGRSQSQFAKEKNVSNPTIFIR